MQFLCGIAAGVFVVAEQVRCFFGFGALFRSLIGGACARAQWVDHCWALYSAMPDAAPGAALAAGVDSLSLFEYGAERVVVDHQGVARARCARVC